MDSLCRKLGIESYLDFIVTPEDAGADKPDPAIFTFALSKGGIKPEEAIFVGDQYKVDIVGARAAGIKQAILIDRPGISEPLSDCTIIRSFGELPDML